MEYPVDELITAISENPNNCRFGGTKHSGSTIDEILTCFGCLEQGIRQQAFEDLAKRIAKRFTPYAFSCNCMEPSCLTARESTYEIAQNETVRLIVDYIKQEGNK